MFSLGIAPDFPMDAAFECQRAGELDELFEKAFPGCQWSPVDDMAKFQPRLLRPGLKRWLDASELSDGTLRFFSL